MTPGTHKNKHSNIHKIIFKYLVQKIITLLKTNYILQKTKHIENLTPNKYNPKTYKSHRNN